MEPYQQNLVCEVVPSEPVDLANCRFIDGDSSVVGLVFVAGIVTGLVLLVVSILLSDR